MILATKRAESGVEEHQSGARFWWMRNLEHVLPIIQANPSSRLHPLPS